MLYEACVDICKVIFSALTSYVSAETHVACLLKDTGNSTCEDVYTHTEGRFCLFIFGNGFVGISDLSLTGTQTDITSCTQILAQCRGVKKQQSAFFGNRAFISLTIGEGCIDECSYQEGSCFCNLISFKFKHKYKGFTFQLYV